MRSGLGRFLGERALWAGFVAAVLPLLVLLGLQFLWLRRLERVSAIAHKAALLWKAKPVEGAGRLFLVDYTRSPFGNILVFDPDRGVLESPFATDEAVSIIIACTPWQMVSARRRPAPPAGLHVDERNPEYRMILNPITDGASRVVGVAGMILDEEYFARTLLSKVIARAVPSFFPETARGDLVVTVRDARGNTVPAGGEEPHGGPPVTARVPFVYNVTLSVLVAGVLVGGVSLALRAAGRAMKLGRMKSDFV